MIVKVRVRGVALDEKTLGDTIAKRAPLLGMTAWTITPYSVTLRPSITATWLDLAATLNAMAHKLGGRLKCAATGDYHYEIVVAEAKMRATA